MTDIVHRSLKRITPLALAALFAAAPFAAHADDLQLSLGSGAPPKSLIGAPSLGAPIGRLSYSGLIGLDLPPSGFNAGPKISGELMYAVTDLAPQLRLDLGGRVAWAYHGWSGGFSGSSWLLDIVPDAKLRYGINDDFGVYGDFGIGLVYIGGDGNTGAGLAIKFGAGVAYAITPTMNLLGELRINIYSKDGTETFITVPTIGLEFH